MWDPGIISDMLAHHFGAQGQHGKSDHVWCGFTYSTGFTYNRNRYVHGPATQEAQDSHILLEE
jgi:hypothetical protein